MAMQKRDYRDLIGGFVLTALGIFVVVYGQRYELGSLRQMGPGYFPTALGVLLAILGAFIIVPAFFRKGTSIEFDWKTVAWVTTSIFVFALVLESLGILVATAISVIVASMPAKLRTRDRLTLAISICALVYLIFIFGLGMPLPVWPLSD